MSLAVHGLFILLCAVMLGHQAAQERLSSAKKLTWIQLDPVVPKPTVPKNREDETHKRIVQTSNGNLTDKAAPDAFLGERTQTVDRQTVSKNKQIAIGKDTAKPSTSTEARSKVQSPKQKSVAAAPALPALGNLGVAVLPTKKELEKIAKEQEKDTPRWAGAGEQLPQDYVQGMKESEKTALNTREYVFFGYYQRIRERLDRAWVPILRQNLSKYYRNGRQLASEMEHTTKVMVVLNKTGEIVKVQIVGESGTADLDDAAVKAFNRAGPFPNPPHGIMNKEGEIRIPWEFILRT